MQKILAGSARGRSLKSLPDSYPVRPILGRIKKSLFDILQFKLPGARFLDLYAGTGSVGMEALSRGAEFCCFVEEDTRCIRLLNENLQHLKFDHQAKVIRADVLGNLNSLGAAFNIIFMGPPYVDQKKQELALTAPTLANIVRCNLLAPNGLIISQRQKKEPITDIPAVLDEYRIERYGDTLVSFFKINQETK